MRDIPELGLFTFNDFTEEPGVYFQSFKQTVNGIERKIIKFQEISHNFLTKTKLTFSLCFFFFFFSVVSSVEKCEQLHYKIHLLFTGVVKAGALPLKPART